MSRPAVSNGVSTAYGCRRPGGAGLRHRPGGAALDPSSSTSTTQTSRRLCRASVISADAATAQDDAREAVVRRGCPLDPLGVAAHRVEGADLHERDRRERRQ